MPRTGRPIKGKEKKDKTLQLRLSESTMNKLAYCAGIKNVSRTEIVEQGINIIFESLIKD